MKILTFIGFIAVKAIDCMLGVIILTLGFLLIVLPEIIYFSLVEFYDWIGDRLR